MKAAIIQPNYLPWKGYFDIINEVDIFVFLEDVQYTKNGWRNRNKIKTPRGTEWITVPVISDIHKKIFETKIDYSQNWAKKHRKMIHANYAASEYYDTYNEKIFEIYNQKCETISELNIYAIKKISKILDINTEFINSTILDTCGIKDDKVIEICKQIGADEYLSGPSAENYIVNEKFEKAGITLDYKNYSGYLEYPQLWGDFNHFVSIIDVIFNCGGTAPYYMCNRGNDPKN